MYDVIYGIIDHAWVTGTSEQQYIYYTCCALVLLLTVVFIDIIKTVFGAYLRR